MRQTYNLLLNHSVLCVYCGGGLGIGLCDASIRMMAAETSYTEQLLSMSFSMELIERYRLLRSLEGILKGGEGCRERSKFR